VGCKGGIWWCKRSLGGCRSSLHNVYYTTRYSTWLCAKECCHFRATLEVSFTSLLNLHNPIPKTGTYKATSDMQVVWLAKPKLLLHNSLANDMELTCNWYANSRNHCIGSNNHQKHSTNELTCSSPMKVFLKKNRSLLIHQTNKWIVGYSDHLYRCFDHFGNSCNQNKVAQV